MRRLLLALLPVALVLLAACSGGPPSAGTGARGVLVLRDASAGNSARLLNAARERAAELDVDIETFDAGGDADRLSGLVESALDDDVAVLLVEPAQWKGLEEVSRRADAADVGFILVGDQASVTGGTYVGPDPAEVGRVQLQGVADSVAGTGDLAVLRVVNRTPYAYGFEEGYQEVLTANPGLEVVFDQPANGNAALAAEAVDTLLGRGLEPAVVVAQDETMATAARRTLTEAGRGDIAVVGTGTSDATLNALLDDAPGGTVWTDPHALGLRAAEVAAAVVAGARIGEEVHVPGAEWVDASNVHEYLHE